MPAPTRPDEETSRIQQGYDSNHGAFLSDSENQEFKSIEDGFNQSADPAQENGNIDRAQQQLSAAEGSSQWANNTSALPHNKSIKGGKVSAARKRGGIFGLLGLLGVGGGLMAVFFGPGGMLIGLSENLTFTNDSTSVATERRFMRVFQNMAAGDTNICDGGTKLKCKMGRISNSALRTLSRNGIVPLDASGNQISTPRTGYPSGGNPDRYRIDMGNGTTTEIPKSELRSFLLASENRKIANKVLGRSGAFNMRVTTKVGNYLNKKLYSKFGIERKGGLADGTNRQGTLEERRTNARSTLNRPSSTTPETVAGRIGNKAQKTTNGAKKGGVGYLIAVAGCVAVKVPGFIAAGVAAVQLSQVMPIIMDVVLSPASKAKANSVENDFTSTDMETVGTLLTEKSEREGDGKMTSALDSAVLLSAMGVNSGRPAVPSSVSPGYSALTNPVVRGSNEAAAFMEPACNVIMSPAAMYTAMAADAAVTVAASSTVVGGLLKIAASWAISVVISEGVKIITDMASESVISAIMEDYDIGSAQGEQFGDVLGVSALAFFSANGMARHLPTLNTSQLLAWDGVRKENEQFQREMAIAGLSPFDTSTPYTFLGSAVHTMRTAMLANGLYNNNATSILSSLIRIPGTALSTNAGAQTGYSSELCSYAEDFYLNSDPTAENPVPDPAINAAGMPCTGLSPTQASMDTSLAMQLLVDEGWICDEDREDCPDIEEGMSIDDLMPESYCEGIPVEGDETVDGGGEELGSQCIGYIKDDNPLYDFISDCSDASSGDYIFNAGGCVTTTNTQSVNVTSCADTIGETVTNDDGEEETVTRDACEAVAENSENSEGLPDLKDGRSLEAMSVFLLDYQIMTMVNGEDEEENQAAAPESNDSTSIDLDALYTDSTSVSCHSSTNEVRNDTGYTGGNAVPVKLCALPNATEGTLVNSRVSGAVYDMFEQMKEDLDMDQVPINSSFRTMADQQEAYNRYGPGQAASPGYSNHQMGVALDFGGGGCSYSAGVTSCSNSRIWTWLNENASRFGFQQLHNEWWHWSPDGR